jgi:MoxR-like ATPase
MENKTYIMAEQAKEESQRWDVLRQEVAKVVVGCQKIVDRIIIGLLCNGHILLEGAPGLAKTTLVRTIAKGVGLTFSRIQFTPDLLPSDIVGTLIYNPKTQEFVTKKGPIFAGVILADEINRAPAKVQSSLLEAMQEQQVTIGDLSHKIATPFIVLATQNPIDQEGTYALPEAQVDRFMLKILIDYPTRADELEIINKSNNPEAANQVFERADIERGQTMVERIFCDQRINEYILDIVRMTRPCDSTPDSIKGLMRFGASPRAVISLNKACRAHAFIKKRHFVIPDDVKAVAYDVLRHRIILTYEAEIDNLKVEDVIKEILDMVKSP